MVNGALEYLAADLGIAENTVSQGKLFLNDSIIFSFSADNASFCLWHIQISNPHISVNILFRVLMYIFVSLTTCLGVQLRDLIFPTGWVVSTLLAGATVGSFTGGTLADKFGRTKTFILDAIPLTIGAFLWYVPCTLMMMVSFCNMVVIISY